MKYVLQSVKRFSACDQQRTLCGLCGQVYTDRRGLMESPPGLPASRVPSSRLSPYCLMHCHTGRLPSWPDTHFQPHSGCDLKQLRRRTAFLPTLLLMVTAHMLTLHSFGQEWVNMILLLPRACGFLFLFLTIDLTNT